MAIIYNKPKAFAKQPSLLEQHGKPVFIHPAQRDIKRSRIGCGSIKTSWPTNSKHD